MKTSFFSFLLPLALQLAVAVESRPFSSNGYTPQAKPRNGTIYGVYNEECRVDEFLGIPYAEPPVGNLRFRPPKFLNTKRSLNATQYGKWCYGPAFENAGQDMSEDCLTLNVVRPVNINQFAKLPVAVWIHGGGFTGGGSARHTYNMSYMVQQSVEMGTPIIGVSINYRLSIFGFPGGREVAGTRNTNLGLKDQRLALHWVQENIRSFGGDPFKITVFGESAGAASVSWHQLAWGGRDDGLFARAILQSGSSMIGPSVWPETYQSSFNSLAVSTGCGGAIDKLQCLRTVDINAIWKWAQEKSYSSFPMIDGDMIPAYSSKMIRDGQFVKVPTIIGVTSDEWTLFTETGPDAPNTEAELASKIKNMMGISSAHTSEILSIYDSTVSLPPAENYTDTELPSSLGAQFFRSAAITTDYLMISPKRFIAQQFVARNVPVWTYRFKCVPNGFPAYLGAAHFSEVAFVFHNTETYDLILKANPMGGPFRSEFIELSKLMVRSWIKFFVTGDPSGAVDGAPAWPQYGHGAKEMVFDRGVGNTFVSVDDYRAQGINWFITHAATLNQRMALSMEYDY